jgi:hypothetical protein
MGLAIAREDGRKRPEGLNPSLLRRRKFAIAKLHGLVADLALPMRRRIENTMPLQSTVVIEAGRAMRRADGNYCKQQYISSTTNNRGYGRPLTKAPGNVCCRARFGIFNFTNGRI